MIMNGARGSTAREGGFAARALRRTDDAPDVRRRVEGEARDGRARNGERRAAAGADAYASMEAPRPVARQPRDPQRVKRLATIAAASVAIAFASLAYGVWTQATSRAAVEEATAGAMPTLVASTDIRAGDVLSPEAVEERLVPQAFRASSALEGGAVEGDAAGGKRAVVDIPAGAQITSSLVTGVEGAGHLAAELQPGMQAVTIAVDSETGIAGQVKVYDAVRVVSAESASSGEALLQTVCERARVVSVGDGVGGDGAAYASVTVEVSPLEADAVREAQYAGRVSLVLISSGDVLDGGDDRG